MKKRYYSRNRRSVTIIKGISLKVGSQFVCWNSSTGRFYLGKHKFSEVFSFRDVHPFKNDLPTRLYRTAIELYPSAKVLWELDKSA